MTLQTFDFKDFIDFFTDFMTLLQHEIMHLVLSLLAGLTVYYFYSKKHGFCRDSKSKQGVIFLAALAGGFFIDIDHWFDNWIAYGINFDLARFFSGNYFSTNGKVFILFHGWEYVIILSIAGYKLKKYQPIFFALALSLFLHLCFDSILNGISVMGYSILYRALNGFQV